MYHNLSMMSSRDILIMIWLVIQISRHPSVVGRAPRPLYHKRGFVIHKLSGPSQLRCKSTTTRGVACHRQGGAGEIAGCGLTTTMDLAATTHVSSSSSAFASFRSGASKPSVNQP